MGVAFLTRDSERNSETTSQQCVTLFKGDLKQLLCRSLTVDGTWLHWYTSETKQ